MFISHRILGGRQPVSLQPLLAILNVLVVYRLPPALQLSDLDRNTASGGTVMVPDPSPRVLGEDGWFVALDDLAAYRIHEHDVHAFVGDLRNGKREVATQHLRPLGI